MSKTIYLQVIAGLFLFTATVPGAEPPVKFLGAGSCGSTSCHGGGGAKQNQFLVWSLKDFHSQRPAATLTTARSRQIAEALNLKDPADDARCTVCHSPLHEVPAARRGEHFRVNEGVTCESCHSPAERWLRGHTRTDWTRADRTAAGMRDLQNLYVRANICVACHQNVDPDILQAGHPELIFELDGLGVAEPKHWSAEKDGNGAQAWLVGQAVALREMSWQLAREASPSENDLNRWKALLWLVNQSADASFGHPVNDWTPGASKEQFQKSSDELAHKVASTLWSDAITRKTLSVLAGTSNTFRDGSISQNLHARSAERLVLALDRLVAALPESKTNTPAQSALNQLFKLAQSVSDFDAKEFADALDQFSAGVCR